MEHKNNASNFEQLKDPNLVDITAGNFNVLIINNFLDQIVNENIEKKMISQVYMLCYLFKHVIDCNAFRKIHMCTEEYFDFHALWNENSPMGKFIDEFIYRQPWKKIDLNTYDVIICHPLYENDLLVHLTENYPAFLNQKPGSPKFFSLVDTSSIASHADFLPYVTLLTDYLVPSFSPDKVASIRSFKEIIATDYSGFALPQQEALFKDLIETIGNSNKKIPVSFLKKILLVDDHKRGFYIGDSCFWLQNINVNLKNTFPGSEITVICRDQKKINNFNKIFNFSLDENLTFNYSGWDDLDFSSYDLILYDSDLSIRFLTYIQQHYASGFKGKLILNYSSRSIKEHELLSALYFRHHFKTGPKADLIDNIKAAKANAEFEIKMQKWEKDASRQWLLSKGLKDHEKITVLIFNSSSEFKMLSPEIQLELIGSIAKYSIGKILLFDDKGIGLENQLNLKLGKGLMRKIIVAEELGIRMDMALLSDSAVAAIISPCTGMMHLANGLFRYLRKNSLIERNDIPLMLVYTGNLMNFDVAYHPSIWWSNSLVKCVVFAQTNEGAALIRLKDVPSSTPEYNRIALPLSEMKPGHLFNFLKKNHSRMGEEMFNISFLTAAE